MYEEVETVLPGDGEDEHNGFFDGLTREQNQDWNSLAQVGRLTETFHWLGHEFVMRTLKVDEEIAIGQVIKHLEGVVTQEKAAVAAYVAASLVSVNGAPFMVDIEKETFSNLLARYKYLIDKYHWPVIEYLQGKLLELQIKVYELIKELEKKYETEPTQS